MKLIFSILFLLFSFSVFGQQRFDCEGKPIENSVILRDPLRDPETWEKLVRKPTDRQLWERYVNKPETEWTKEIQDSVKKWKQIFMIRRLYDMDNFCGFNPNFEPYYENGVVIKDRDFERIIESKGDTAILNKIIVQNPKNDLEMYIFMPSPPETDFEALEKYFSKILTIFGKKYRTYQNRPTQAAKITKKEWIEDYIAILKMLKEKSGIKIIKLLVK